MLEVEAVVLPIGAESKPSLSRVATATAAAPRPVGGEGGGFFGWFQGIT